MTRFIEKELNLNHQDAFALQKKYWLDYGTTLSGMMRHHGTEPDAFLQFVHDVDISTLAPNDALGTALAALDAPKYIFTNATAAHAENVARQLGILNHFDGIFDIYAANYIPKPQIAPYDKMLSHFNIDPTAAALIEDMARNLSPAAERGMTTIWLRPPPHEDATSHTQMSHIGADEGHIDHVIDALVPFLQSLK